MKTRVQLSDIAKGVICALKDRGCRTSFIARYSQIEYNTHRTTVYRHISNNPSAYEWKEKHSVRKERERQVCELYLSGNNTAQIAGQMKMNLTQVNRIAIRCKKTI